MTALVLLASPHEPIKLTKTTTTVTRQPSYPPPGALPLQLCFQGPNIAYHIPFIQVAVHPARWHNASLLCTAPAAWISWRGSLSLDSELLQMQQAHITEKLCQRRCQLCGAVSAWRSVVRRVQLLCSIRQGFNNSSTWQQLGDE